MLYFWECSKNLYFVPDLPYELVRRADLAQMRTSA
jgi:hypothetical protein